MKEPRTRYHHGDLRQALLDTALKLVAERGPEGFSLREAAREVGVSPAAAYRHFADKPALLAALASEGHGLLAVAMERGAARAAEGEPEPRRSVARLVGIGQAYVEYAVKNPSFFRVMFGPALKCEAFEPRCSPASGRDAYQVLAETLDGLVAAGAVAPERRVGAEISTWAAVHGLATLLVDGALPLDRRQRADAYVVLVRNVLLGMGCAPALVPEAPARWKDPHPGHERPRARAPATPPRATPR